MRFINLTPHALHIRMADGTYVDIPPSGTVARRAVERIVVGSIDGITIYGTRFGELEGLPAPIEGTFYIISALAAQASAGRKDILVPGDAIRDEQGRVVGCNGLCRI